MKSINSIILLLLLGSAALFGQDVQGLYDQAREALSAGKFELALNMIAEARSDIQKDPRVDPNHVFANRLLPQVEKNARNMADMVQALQELYSNAQNSLAFPELAPGPDAVRQYNDQAKQVSSELTVKRDEILTRFVLEPEYRDALRKLPVYVQIEQLASVGIMDKLSDKFGKMAGVLVDSLNSVDRRYRQAEFTLAKMAKSAAASKAQVEKASKEVAKLSQERLNYINSISEMLAGEPSTEQPKVPMTLMGNQVENVFNNTIQSEIKRLREMTSVDSAGYKELVRNYDKIQSYNRIFARNKITADQSELLAQYKLALDAIQVQVPKKAVNNNLLLFGGALLLVIVVVIVVAAGKKRATGPPPARPVGMGK